MTQKAEISDSAVQSTRVLRELIQTSENEGENFFSVLRTETSPLCTSMHCLRQ